MCACRPVRKTKCNCKKTQCLKLYCECFKAGQMCVDCSCQGCSNTPANLCAQPHCVYTLSCRSAIGPGHARDVRTKDATKPLHLPSPTRWHIDLSMHMDLCRNFDGNACLVAALPKP